MNSVIIDIGILVVIGILLGYLEVIITKKILISTEGSSKGVFAYYLLLIPSSMVLIYLFSKNPFQYIFYLAMTLILAVIAFIDEKTMEIPLPLNILILLVGILRLVWNTDQWYYHILGFFLVSVFFLIIFFLTKGEGIGGGDIKLMAVSGFVLGAKLILLSLVLASIIGTLVHLSRMLFKQAGRQLAFGPYLSIGIFCSMLFGEKIIDWYFQYFFKGI